MGGLDTRKRKVKVRVADFPPCLSLSIIQAPRTTDLCILYTRTCYLCARLLRALSVERGLQSFGYTRFSPSHSSHNDSTTMPRKGAAGGGSDDFAPGAKSRAQKEASAKEKGAAVRARRPPVYHIYINAACLTPPGPPAGVREEGSGGRRGVGIRFKLAQRRQESRGRESEGRARGAEGRGGRAAARGGGRGE